MTSSLYPLSELGHDAWRGGEPGSDYISRAAASKWQYALVQAVKDAIQTKCLFYQSDIFDHVVAIFKNGGWINDEILAKGKGRVERGDFGMQVYYARNALDQWNEQDRVIALRDEFNPGMTFKNVRINYDKYSKLEIVEASNPFGIKVKLTKRGSKHRYYATLNASRLKTIIDRGLS